MTRYLRALMALLVVAGTAVAVTPGAMAARTPSYARVTGSGTSWSAPALFQWAADVRAAKKLDVEYNPDGSAEGRTDFIDGDQDDFAASDPPFRSGDDKLAGNGPEVVPWGYSYVPDLAGGTAFAYHLTVDGKKITDLKLTPAVLAGIFTGTITNWDSPQITKAYGHQLPSLAITPVLHSDGAGATYFLSSWLAATFPSQWNAFCQRVHPGLTPPCGATEFYPTFGDAKAQNGDSNVVAYLASKYGNGAIGYTPYAYALSSQLPSVAVRNPAGKFVRPTPANVTTALKAALINVNPQSKDYLQQNLSHVYTSTAPGSYPLSAYSYLIVPRQGTRIPPVFSTAAGTSLRAYLSYGLCGGQQELATLGYAPLPTALVQGALTRVADIPGGGTVPSSCS